MKWRILGLVFLNQLVWINAVPFNFAPDEDVHWELVSRTAALRRFPNPNLDYLPDGIAPGTSRNQLTYAFLQPLPYLVAAAPVIYKNHYLSARAVSGLWVVILVWSVFGIVERWTQDKTLAAYSALGVGMIPQISFLGAYVNSDISAIALVGVVLWLAVRGQVKTWGIALGAAALTRYNAYPALLLSALVLGRRALAGLVIAGLIAGPWLWTHLGDTQRFYTLARQSSPEQFHNFGIWTMLAGTTWLPTTLKSAFGMFDWNFLALPDGVYIFVLILAAIIVFKSLTKINKWIVWARLTILATFALAVFYSAKGAYQPQGRYLLVAIAAWGILLAAAGRKWAKIWAMVCVGCNLGSMAGVILPGYYAAGMGLTGLDFYKQAFWEIVYAKPWPFNWWGFGVIVGLWIAVYLSCAQAFTRPLSPGPFQNR